MRRIDAALARIKDGSFGVCTVCGDDIAAERLDAVPDTPFCATCAR
ncbi:MAG: TraR/DksA family transcriptional regulator [Boseongicola sp.]